MSTNRRRKHQIKTDISKQYLIDLCIQGEGYVTANVVCNVREENGFIVATAAENPELFEVHRYIDDFFQWLMYRGIIKLYDKEAIENNNEP